MNKTIRDILEELANKYVDGIFNPNSLDNEIDQALTEIEAIGKEVIAESRWSKIGQGAKGSIMWSQQLGHEKALDAVALRLQERLGRERKQDEKK